ncbi:hypothetical protein [Paucilactobacillus sp. N302-9]
MQIKTILKKSLLGVMSVLLAVTMAACGNTSKSAKSDQTSQATSSKVSPATKAYKKANQLIDQGKYDQALQKLKDAPQTSKIKGLLANLKTYMQASDDYKAQDYDSAQTGIDTLKSNADASSSELKQKVSSLADKVQNRGTKTTASTQVTSSSQASTPTDKNTIVSNFAKSIGLYGKSDYAFSVTNQSGNVYTIEVRQNNATNDVASLIGIYQYNASTNVATKTN